MTRLSWCKACTGVYVAEYNRKHPEVRRSAGRKWRYGLTDDDEAAMEAKQDGLCLICERPLPPMGSRSRHVDHNHETGRIRGLLCHACNLALGLTQEDLPTLRRMIAYLELDAELAASEDDRRPIAPQAAYLAKKSKERRMVRPLPVPGEDY